MADPGDPNQPSEDWQAWLDTELAKSAVVAPPETPAPAPELQAQEPPAPEPAPTVAPLPDPSRPPTRAAAAVAAANAPATAAAPTKRKRVSRWDRPPEPHDWRWVVGHIGRALIALGLLMFGFVAYQLWGTGLETARAQNKLENQFEDKLDSLPRTPDSILPATSTVATVTPSTTATGDTTVDTTTGTGVDTSTTVAAETTTTVPSGPVDQDYGVIHDGEGIGKITIPRIDVNFFYVAGVSKSDLDLGVGHFPKSVVPGQLGNAALAGHRTSHLAPFEDLDKLEPGDEVIIETILGGAYLYIVTGSEVVDPSDYHVVTDSDPTKATLTLITCTPKYTSRQRLVVHAELDTTRTVSPIGVGEIYYGQADPDAALGADTLPDDGLAEETSTTAAPTTTLAPEPTTTLLAADPAATTIAPAVVVPEPATTTIPVTTVPAAAAPTTVPTAEEVIVDIEDEFADDAFQQGWFDDRDAIPHVIGWTALFAAIWYGAWRLAKRFRRLWLGILVGFVPYFVVLYFVYENVNRLLPAAI